MGDVQKKKYRIGYTTGVFDMFHIGHLAILKRAKEMCDFLIVGVSTDELVETYKHKMPIVPLADRMEIVGAIRYVDQVVVQTSMDKYAAWEQYHFDALFHGDDWKKSEMYNRIEEKLSEVGVDVVFLPHTPGVSTTILTEVIRSDRRHI
ncbi:MAG: adenylyltransferase/cytidyltransferase family protein [Lachnospiraceae bacterium]|nr:adenylyltransferase/cytidyltransferase family protein [Lachnospiraceae bacterium]